MNKIRHVLASIIKDKYMSKLITISFLLLVVMISFFVALSTRINTVKQESDRLLEIEDMLRNGKYALKEELPNSISELDNDSDFQNSKDVKKLLENNKYVTMFELNDKGFATYANVRNADQVLQKEIDDLSKAVNLINNKLSSQSFNDIRKEVIDTIFPIGSLYYSMDTNFDPNVSWGGTWEKLSEGYFVEATENESLVATQIQAGLPNIIGVSSGNQDVAISGAFYHITNNIKNSGSNSYARKEGFDASLGETKLDGTLKSASDYHVYGKSETVQPNAYYAYIWKRIG